MPVHAHPRVTEFALVAGLDRSAQLRRHGLLAVADPEDGNFHVEDFLRRARGFRLPSPIPGHRKE